MAIDRLNVSVAHLSVPNGVADPDAVHSIGASHFKEYLDIMYGHEMPDDEQARPLADAYHTALGALSTDELLYRTETHPFVRVGRLTGLVTSFIGATAEVGAYVETGLATFDADLTSEAGLSVADNLFYMLGLHDVGSIVIASQLQLRHPRYDNRELMERTVAVTPADHILVGNSPVGERTDLELLLASGVIGGGLQRRLRAAIESGRAIIAKAEEHAAIIRAITEGEQ